MTELFQNAWLGWQKYTYDGKLAALLLAALIFLWFGKKQKDRGTLVIYTAVITVCCILPVTAVPLMLYQTRFYDYEWIWSMVPLTAVSAWGMAVFLTEYWTDFKVEHWRRGVPVTVLLLAAILLCGGLGSGSRTERKAGREGAYAVLEQLREACPGETICLWAPREIMEYAREAESGIKLPYGRNMWDLSLNAYAYDIYNEGTVQLCQWMESVGENGQADMETDSPEAAEKTKESAWFLGTEGKKQTVTLEDSVDSALAAGVNCILLPGNAEAETVRRMENALGTKAQPLGDYYLFLCPSTQA